MATRRQLALVILEVATAPNPVVREESTALGKLLRLLQLMVPAESVVPEKTTPKAPV